MSTTVKTGWLNDKNGDKFAPKTLTSQVQTSDGILIEDKIQTDLDTVKQEILDTIDPNTIMNYLGEVDELPETANKGDTYKPSKLKGEECLIITISGVESIVPISSYPDYENYHNPNEAVINCNSDSDIGRFMHSAYSMMEAGNLEASWNISVAG